MAETWADDELKGPPDGRLYRLTLAFYAYATGEDVAEVETPGGAYDAGLGRHVTAAIRIGRALVARNMPKPGFAPLTDEEFQQRVSLERAWVSGRVPPWLI